MIITSWLSLHILVRDAFSQDLTTHDCPTCLAHIRPPAPQEKSFALPASQTPFLGQFCPRVFPHFRHFSQKSALKWLQIRALLWAYRARESARMQAHLRGRAHLSRSTRSATYLPNSPHLRAHTQASIYVCSYASKSESTMIHVYPPPESSGSRQVIAHICKHNMSWSLRLSFLWKLSPARIWMSSVYICLLFTLFVLPEGCQIVFILLSMMLKRYCSGVDSLFLIYSKCEYSVWEPIQSCPAPFLSSHSCSLPVSYRWRIINVNL